jgi:hypothetical protein
MKRLKTKKALLLVFLLVFYALIFFIYQRFSQSFHFVDEEDHFVFASFYNRGYKLYKDLNTSHQPLVYGASSLIQKIVQPANIYMLVKRHRDVLMILSAIGGVALFFRFGTPAVLFSVLFEGTKYYLFGNLFLGESLAVYPAVFLVGIFIDNLFKKRISKTDCLIVPIASFLALFCLAPIAPLIIIINFFVLLKLSRKQLIFFIAQYFVLFAWLFSWIEPGAYLQVAIVNNLKHHAPAITEIKTNFDYVRLLLFPIFIFGQKMNFLSILIKALFTFLLILLFVNRKKVGIKKMLLILMLFFLLNMRTLELNYFYRGFHLLLWWAGLIFITCYFYFYTLKRKKITILSTITIVFIVGYVLLGEGALWRHSIDKLNEANINYSTFESGGKVIKALSGPNNRLAVFPDETLVYWESGLRPATKQLLYSDWEYSVPGLREQYERVFSSNPPEFIYYNHRLMVSSAHRDFIEPIMQERYHRLVNLRGEPSSIYILSDIKDKVTEEQLSLISNWGFKL